MTLITVFGSSVIAMRTILYLCIRFQCESVSQCQDILSQVLGMITNMFSAASPHAYYGFRPRPHGRLEGLVDQ